MKKVKVGKVYFSVSCAVLKHKWFGGVTLLCARVRDHTSGVCIGVLSGSFSLFPNSVHSLITPLLIKQSQPDLIRRKISKAEMSLSNVVQLGSQMEAKYP